MIEPLLNGKWRKGDIETNIIGKWFEDNQNYEIICPEQLRDCLIAMQNYFVDMYEKRNRAKEIIKTTDHQLFENENNN